MKQKVQKNHGKVQLGYMQNAPLFQRFQNVKMNTANRSITLDQIYLKYGKGYKEELKGSV